jgi:ABC-2 type transport system permease protein
MKIFFPYALLQYNGKEMPIFLLEDPQGRTAAEKVSYAEAMLEYKFANGINQLNKPQKPRIAYVIGNEEEYGVKTLGMLLNLPRYYNLDTIDINRTLNISSYYDAIIINQPKIPFTGPQKLKIDQFVMHGGHVMWVVNSLRASLDSLRNSPQFIGMEYGLNLGRYAVQSMACV